RARVVHAAARRAAAGGARAALTCLPRPGASESRGMTMSDSAMSSTAARPPRTWKKRLLVALVSFLVTIVLFELAARVGGWLVHGRNPYYLFYGFVSWEDDSGEGHSEKLDGYYKFPAHKVLQHMGELPEPGHINNHGFRGPDFETAKPPGTFR